MSVYGAMSGPPSDKFFSNLAAQDAHTADSVECNGHIVAQFHNNDENDEEFVPSSLGAAEEQQLCDDVSYCSKRKTRSGLHLAKERLIKRTYEHRKELGLLSLYLNNSFLNCTRVWTSKELLKRDKRSKPLRMDELRAYLGLELVPSIHSLNRLQEYWSMSDILRIPFFTKVMGRDAFLNIRSALRLYPAYDVDVALHDPLWHSRQILEHFGRNAATLAVPLGVSALDENTIRCKGRTAARSYMKSKPVKFGIRLYAVVGWSHAYLHSFQDNGSGNKTGISPVHRYTHVFRGLLSVVEKKIDGKLLSKTSSSALWCPQMAHQTYLYPSESYGRLTVIDNFYKRHSLSRQLQQLSDNRCRVLGTVRLNNVDAVNRPALKNAIEELKHARRGDWRLVQVFEKQGTTDGSVQVAERAGFIVFRDRSVVSFYCNDLDDSLTQRIHQADEDAKKCVHGLASLKRWTGDEALSRTILQVPSVIVAYNIFMNAVDRFDQYRSTSPTVREEAHVTMSVLMFVLNACVLNAHVFLNAITTVGNDLLGMNTLRKRIIMQLVEGHVEYKQRRATFRTVSAISTTSIDHGSSQEIANTTHVWLVTAGKKPVHCLVCRLIKDSNRGGYTKFTCSECRLGFHDTCFSFFHNMDLLKGCLLDLYNDILSAQK